MDLTSGASSMLQMAYYTLKTTSAVSYHTNCKVMSNHSACNMKN